MKHSIKITSEEYKFEHQLEDILFKEQFITCHPMYQAFMICEFEFNGNKSDVQRFCAEMKLEITHKFGGEIRCFYGKDLFFDRRTNMVSVQLSKCEC